MSERLSRKEIKHDIREDTFRLRMEQVFLWIITHTRALALVGLAIVLLLAGIYWYGTLKQAALDAASEQLAAAIEVYEAPIDAANPKPDAAEPVFADEQSRNRRALELFRAIREDHPGTGAEAVAMVYLGRIQHQLGNPAEARAVWEEFMAEHPDHLLANMVKVSLLNLDRDEGKAAEVAATLRSSLDSVERDLPMDLLLFELAVTLEELEEVDEARATYQRLSDEYPDSPFAQEALSKATELGAGA